jgi:hypothetical protein
MAGCRSSASVFFSFFGEIWIFFDKEIGKWEIFGNFCFSSGNSANFSIFLCD